MSRTLFVAFGTAGTPLGTLHYDRLGARESSAFTYDASWLGRADAFAIDPELRLVPGAHFRRGTADGSPFAGAIADAAPDGWARRVIRREHARRRRRGDPDAPERLDALDELAAVDDETRIGALRFRRDDAFVRRREPGEPGIPPVIALEDLLRASRRLEMQDETDRDLRFLLARGTSLGGLRPKCSTIDDDGRLAIGKFSSIGDERDVVKGEVLALRLARRAGINAAEARLVACAEFSVAIVRRFDRRSDGTRIAYISAATMLGDDPAAPRDHAYTEIVDTLRREGSRTQADIEELWRRIAFSIAITNIDDHVVNHGFLHDETPGWRLAPAFDLNPFPERARELKTWISEESGPAASVAALWETLPYFRISPERGRTILADVEHAVSAWRDEAELLGLTRAEARAFETAFEHPERAVARRIVAHTLG